MKNEDELVPVITEKPEEEKVIEIAEDSVILTDYALSESELAEFHRESSVEYWRTIELPPSPKYKPGAP
jgi:hypothetical protein